MLRRVVASTIGSALPNQGGRSPVELPSTDLTWLDRIFIHPRTLVADKLSRYCPVDVAENPDSSPYRFTVPKGRIDSWQRLKETRDAMSESTVILVPAIELGDGKISGQIVPQIFKHHSGRLRAGQ